LSNRHLLFVSFACYLDDANGAAVASRAMMETLARRGFAAEALCGPLLELDCEIDLPSFLTAKGLLVDPRGGDSWEVRPSGALQRKPAHLRARVNGVPITILPGSTRPRAPSNEEQRDFLALFGEAMLNGVPVIGSNRGGIPETLGSAGPVLLLPDRLSPNAPSLPTAQEVLPWVEAILELWDSPKVYEHASRRALSESRRWAAETLEPRYEQFFTTAGLGEALPDNDK
jgi:hypothetical protein